MIKYLSTKVVPLDELTPFPGNARRGKVSVIRESLERNGQYRSLVVRQIEGGPLVILAGNHTHQALNEAGAKGARCEIIQCDDAAARRINLVDNKSNDLATDDDEALAAILADLALRRAEGHDLERQSPRLWPDVSNLRVKIRL